MAAKRSLDYARVLELAAVASQHPSAEATAQVDGPRPAAEPPWRDTVVQIASVAESIASALRIERPVTE